MHPHIICCNFSMWLCRAHFCSFIRPEVLLLRGSAHYVQSPWVNCCARAGEKENISIVSPGQVGVPQAKILWHQPQLAFPAFKEPVLVDTFLAGRQCDVSTTFSHQAHFVDAPPQP
mmetsp:Transcript_65889/g.117106  ORF Transcript_65889/g.117106 Transcript_65889/m.117106 type:complete len:116 (+) Transcript_65889:2-349(+)